MPKNHKKGQRELLLSLFTFGLMDFIFGNFTMR